jgi:glycosyltransferase involved in cell wall biosynthesis
LNGIDAKAGSMNVLCVIDSLMRAGAERSLAALVPHYIESGVVVDVAYFHDRPGLQEEFRAAGASLFFLGNRGGRIDWIRQTQRLIRERRPDLVHTTLFEADIAGRIAGKLTGVPVVSSLTDPKDGAHHLHDPHIARWKIHGARIADAATARLVARFHAVSTHVADSTSRVLRVPRERIDVIPRGRDPKALGTRSPKRAARVRSTLGLGSSRPVVLAVSRHDKRKGLDVLLEAFRLVLAPSPNARLLVAGHEGTQTGRLHARVAELRLGEAVRFLGAQDDVPGLLCLADVFVLPSRSEGFPGALLEAMALEAPIVATDIAAVREVMGEEDAALLVRPGEPASLAEAIARTLDDPARARNRTLVARRRFLSHYTVDRVADRMLAFYERALAGSRGIHTPIDDMDSRRMPLGKLG